MKQQGSIGILFLGGAKRVAMARMMRKACEKRGLKCRIAGYELDSHSALALEGEIVEGLRWSDPSVFADIDATVDRLGIDIVVPFVDSAVGIAAEYVRKHATSEVFAPVGERELVDKMFDKVAAAELFERYGLPIPATYRAGGSVVKLIAKPRFGSASKGIVEINDLQKLYEIQSKGDRYLIQERIDRREELTVDCYASVHTGEIVAISPRLRCEVSGGEVVRTETIEDKDATALARKAISSLGLRGAITVQLIRDLESGRLMIMEINPRLGGGAVASVHAGVDLPGLIIDDASGGALAVQNPTAGVETVRYLEDVVFYPEEK